MLSVWIVSVLLLGLLGTLIFLSKKTGDNTTQFEGKAAGPAKETKFRTVWKGRLKKGADAEGKDRPTVISNHNSSATVLFFDEAGGRVAFQKRLPLLKRDGDYVLFTRKPIDWNKPDQCIEVVTVPASVGVVGNTVSTPHCALRRQDGRLYLTEIKNYPSKNHMYVWADGKWAVFQKKPLDELLNKTLNFGDMKVIFKHPAVVSNPDTDPAAEAEEREYQFF